MVKSNRSNDALRERNDGGGRKLVEFPNKTQSLRKEMERHREKKRERRLPSPLTAVDFILTVWTVRVPVTPPVCVNTHAAGAFELLAAARRLGPGGDPGAGLRPLVRAVGAVLVPVAGPDLGHAHPVVALEGALGAGGGGAGGFVRTVGAVGVLVAAEGRGDALAAVAAELAFGAVLIHWRKG